jgi:hypothetical protein
MVHALHFWQGNHQTFGHIRCIHMVLANPTNNTPRLHACCVGLARTRYLYGVCRVGQNRMYIPYITVFLMISLPKYRIYTVHIWFWPTLGVCTAFWAGKSQNIWSHALHSYGSGQPYKQHTALACLLLKLTKREPAAPLASSRRREIVEPLAFSLPVSLCNRSARTECWSVLGP